MKMMALVATLMTVASVATAHGEQPPSELRPSPVVVENAGDRTIACGLLFAHWYRQDFAAIEPGASLVLPLEFAPASEAVYLVNSVHRPMAVQDLFCARQGTDWKRVTHLDYRALALRALDKPLHVRCAATDKGVACDAASF